MDQIEFWEKHHSTIYNALYIATEALSAEIVKLEQASLHTIAQQLRNSREKFSTAIADGFAQSDEYADGFTDE